MKPSRDDIVELLRRNADATTPPADPGFVERLERRLRSIDLTPTKAGRRRLGRFTISAIVAGTMVAGAAAAAGVVSWRNSSSQPTATSPTVVVTSTSQVPVPASAEVVTTTSIAPPTTPPQTTTVAAVPATTTPPTASTEAATTTAPVTTLPPPTTAATNAVTTSTEVRVAATLTLTCAPAPAATSCSWDAGPDGTTQYALLRTEPGGSAGRVFTPEPGSTTYLDTLVVAGTTYTYLVHALDATGHSLAHSGPVSTPCCG
jgi:hypothetical protein